VPPFVIFHDATLSEMMERRPENREQLLRINGIGETKLEKYADAFLKVISEHKNNEASVASDTISETLLLFRNGLDINTIAGKRNIKTSTVYAHLASCIEQGELNLDEVIDIDAQDISIIHETLLSISDDSRKLKPVYDALDGMFDYNVLRCVQAATLPS
jgi:ATP-dependent DNA helicase RecQ